MFYFIFVARMPCFCPIATISFRSSCHICSDGMKNTSVCLVVRGRLCIK